MILLVAAVFSSAGSVCHTIVADSATRMPLPSASIFDRHGNALGISRTDGQLPFVDSDSYPITIRYIGFSEKTVQSAGIDTVFMQEAALQLPEILVASRRHKVMHMLAYVREYSTMTTYTDTIFLFREKMVDYMIATDRDVKFKGWTSPRILTCRSYYRFTDVNGLDSVSDVSNHHFSWSDWIGIVSGARIPEALQEVKCGTDTLRGRYIPAEIWSRNDGRVIVDVDVMADTTSRKWIPNLAGFFRNGLEFETFKVRFSYENVAGGLISPQDLTGYSFDIESRGRGHKMFRFNRINEPFFVRTYAEVYILDKEYITVKEAKKWERCRLDIDEIGIYEPQEVPELQPAVRDLVDRVNNISKDAVRLSQEPDRRLAGRYTGGRNFKVGRRALALLKQFAGITLLKSHRNFNNRWDKFRDEQKRRNVCHDSESLPAGDPPDDR